MQIVMGEGLAYISLLADSKGQVIMGWWSAHDDCLSLILPE